MPATAFIGPALSIGAGLLTANKAGKAASAAQQQQAAASGRAESAAATTRNFFQKQFDRSRRLFGELEKDRVRALERLNPDNLRAQALQAIRLGAQRSQKRLTEITSQRNLEGSGLEARAAFDLAVQQASAEAQAELDAPLQAANILGQATQQGAQQQAGYAQGVLGATGQQVSAASHTASIYANRAAAATSQEYAAIGTAVGTLSRLGPKGLADKIKEGS